MAGTGIEVRTPSHPETPAEKQPTASTITLTHKSFRFWEREISSGRFPTSPELTDLLEANSGDAIPSWLIPILVLGLRGKLKQPAGRPPATVLQSTLLQLAIAMYPRYLAWLKAREKRSGLTGWSLIRESDWWVGPPHEREDSHRALASAHGLAVIFEPHPFTKTAPVFL